MSDEHEEKVPGVTFWFKKSSFAAAHGDEKFGVELSLHCSVVDEELWRTVEQKFKDGFRIYSVPDFHIEVLDVMRMELKELKDKNTLLERQVAQEKDARLQVQRELEQVKAPLSALGRALGG